MLKTGYGSKLNVCSELGPCGAVICVKAGKKTAMGYYVDNSVVLYVQDGSVNIRSIIDGVVKDTVFGEGQAITIARGTIFQLVGHTNATVVEFGSNNRCYLQGNNDAKFKVIEKESPMEDVRPDELPSIVMTEVDKAQVEESAEVVEEPVKKVVKKKSSRRKKVAKKD